MPHQAVLTGSGTMLAAVVGQDIDMSGEDTEPSPGAAAAVPCSQSGITSAPCESTPDGGLNGALLRARLVSEVSVVIAPHLAASAAADPSRLIAGPGSAGAVTLELTAMEHLRQGHVWLPYDVRDGPGG